MRIPLLIFALLMLLSWRPAGAEDFYTLVETGTPEQVQAAIAQGAQVTAPDKDGVTPLMHAATKTTHPEVITALLQAGADIKSNYDHVWTPLFFAAQNNQHQEIIRVLVKAGADVNGCSDDGE